MIQGEGIEELVQLLKRRGAYLYHACQLVDFQSYLNLGGIPSRAHIESMEQSYTQFDTDESDRTSKVWDKVFANLQDFSFTFARGGPAVPNTYGPILFQIQPEALHDVTDVAICLRSAGVMEGSSTTCRRSLAPKALTTTLYIRTYATVTRDRQPSLDSEHGGKRSVADREGFRV